MGWRQRFRSHVYLTPSLEHTPPKSDAPRVAALIGMKPSHKISHVPPNLASPVSVLRAKDASWGRAAKQHHTEDVELNDVDYFVLIQTSQPFCLIKCLGVPRQNLQQKSYSRWQRLPTQ